MAKIVLPDVSGGYNLQRINDNFDLIADAFNNGTLWRNTPDGEPNEMLNDLDMNGKRIYNLPKPTLDHEAARWEEVKGLNNAVEDSLANALRAEAAAIVAEAAEADAVAAASSAASSAVDAQASEDATEDLLFDFNKRYLGAAATDPTTDLNGNPLQAGALYFNTALGAMREYNGSAWVPFGSASGIFVKRPPNSLPYIASAGQTTFAVAGGYTYGQIVIFLNGVSISGDEVDLSSGTNIVLTTPATAGDEIDYYAFTTFEVANTMPTEDIVSSIDAAVDAAAFEHGQCEFVYVSSTECRLMPKNGNCLIINGKQYRIPQAGIAISNVGLAASSSYYVYARDNGTDTGVILLGAELKASAPHSTGVNGVEIKTGDATKTLVGSFTTTAASAFLWTATDKRVASWFNRRTRACRETGSGPTASLTPVQHTPGVNIEAWAGGILQLTLSGECHATVASSGASIGLRVNSVLNAGNYGYTPGAVGNQQATAINSIYEVVSDGLHNIAPYVYVSSGTVQFAEDTCVIYSGN